MPPLTLRSLARLARQHDAKTWDSMSRDERQLLLDMLNKERSNRANERFIEAIQAPALKEMAEKKRKRK